MRNSALKVNIELYLLGLLCTAAWRRNRTGRRWWQTTPVYTPLSGRWSRAEGSSRRSSTTRGQRSPWSGRRSHCSPTWTQKHGVELKTVQQLWKGHFSTRSLFSVWLLLGEDSGDTLRVAVDCVEEPGEGEAEDGSQEKHPDGHLLLERSHKRHVGPEHVHQPQTQEKQAACGDTRWQSNINPAPTIPLHSLSSSEALRSLVVAIEHQPNRPNQDK